MLGDAGRAAAGLGAKACGGAEEAGRELERLELEVRLEWTQNRSSCSD